jgi:cytidylate kinase
MAILTVSREFGSGGREIGRAVAESLGYEYIDKERILSDIGSLGKKWEEWGKNLDEHCPTIWEKYDWSFRGFGALVERFILDYALKDRVVIMGRGGHFLLKGIPCALRIRVTAPVERRVDRIMTRESVDRDTAFWLVEKTDRERACFIHALYGKRWDDPDEFDMTFDTGSQSLDEVADIVKKALLEKEQFNTEKVRAVIQGRSLAASVKAEIATDPGFFIPTLDVHHDGKSLVLRGVIHSPAEHKRIEERARKLAGEVPLRCELHYRK